MAIKLQGTNSAAAPGLTNDGGDGVVVGTDSVDISIGGVSKINVDSSGNTTCSGKVHITDDLASGQLLVGTSTSDATTKYGTFNVPHKTNSEEPVMVIAGESTTSNSQSIYIGGGFSTQNAAKVIRFYTAADTTTVTGTQRATIDSDGLKFNADTAAANALNDYEEGSFTPSWSNTTTTTASSVWRYVKIGRLVTVWGRFQCDTTTNNAAHDFYFTNLPFTSAAALTNNMNEFTSAVTTFQVNTDGHTITTYMGAGTTQLDFYQTSDSANWDTLRTDDVTNGSRMIVTHTYMTA